jgi:hypothetical protein
MTVMTMVAGDQRYLVRQPSTIRRGTRATRIEVRSHPRNLLRHCTQASVQPSASITIDYAILTSFASLHLTKSANSLIRAIRCESISRRYGVAPDNCLRSGPTRGKAVR